MNKIKLNKIGSLLLVVVSSFSFFGCGVSTDNNVGILQKEVTKTKVIIKDDLYAKTDVSFNDTITVNDNVYTLQDVTYEDDVITTRAITLSETINYGYQTYKPSPADTVTVEYYDNKLAVTEDNIIDVATINTSDTASGGELLEYTLPMTEFAMCEDWQWRDDFVATMTIYNYNSAYYQLQEGVYMPYNDTSPQISGFEPYLLQYLGLSEEYYKITSAAWVGDTYYNSEGVLCRNAELYGQRYTATYNANYKNTVLLPNVEGFKATATYTYTCIVIDPVKAVSIGVIFIATAFVAILLILAQKRKKSQTEIK